MGNQINIRNKDTFTPKKLGPVNRIECFEVEQVKSRSSNKEGLYAQDKLFENYESTFILLRHIYIRLPLRFRS